MFILHFRLLQKVCIHSTPTTQIWKLSQVYTKFYRFFLANSWRGFNNIMNWWDITPPPFMYSVFNHIYGHFQWKYFFGKFYKKLVKGRTLPPGWYKLPSFSADGTRTPKPKNWKDDEFNYSIQHSKLWWIYTKSIRSDLCVDRYLTNILYLFNLCDKYSQM